MITNGMTCDELAALAAAYLEGDLAPAQRPAADVHLSACPDCAALVADLRRIAAEAGALPVLAPSRDLWDGISARIEAPVIALPPARAGASDAPRRRPQWVWLSVAAAALVLLTAGFTYVVTTRVLSRRAPANDIAVTPQPQLNDGPIIHDSSASTFPGVVRTQDEGLRTQVDGRRTQVDGRRTQDQPRPSALPLDNPRVRNVASAPASESAPLHVADATYAKEIAYLERILERRRSQLDTATVAVLERNFAVIDAAIVESRAALARDPASGFLNDQLKTMLEQKLELLRTAATLPARSE